MKHRHLDLQFHYLLPYGALLEERGVQFTVFSRNATSMRVLLYDHVDDLEPAEIIEFDPEVNRWGDIWSTFVQGIRAGQLYHLQADGPHQPELGHRFDGQARLIDPYCKALAGHFQPASHGVLRPPKCVVVDDYFDWQGDRHLKRDLSESVIYEMHVRGFTNSPTGGVEKPGTYLGIIEKIPYLQELGVTAVELMPIHEFPTRAFDGSTGGIENYWGYDPLALFAPHRGYASGSQPGAQVTEFKQMVKALHQAGIEVILDVVFNHTCEGNQHGPVLSFKGLENSVYYMLDGGCNYKNYSGCGNTVNGNHPIVRELIFHCLRHWVHNYHIDGFRFDLASILSRDRAGHLVPNPPLIEAIGEDPLLADTKIIAEAWDAAGAYQVGSFGCSRWAEWNGRYRDDVRRYWRGDPGMLGAIATRLAGSSDLYQPGGRRPYSSINFVTSHDGFTLNDLVTYREKHNHANGEDNRDGDNNNFSDNYGVEGETDRTEINRLRQRQIKNMLATLLLSQGVPMMIAGDEFRRTQNGNNNAYCQDNEVSWIDWRLVEQNKDLVRFCRGLIAFRRAQPTVRRTQFLTGQPRGSSDLPDVSWYGVDGEPIHWDDHRQAVICMLAPPTTEDDPDRQGRPLLIMMNASDQTQKFMAPALADHHRWSLFVDTNRPSPRDIFPNFDGPTLSTARPLCSAEKSLICFVGT